MALTDSDFQNLNTGLVKKRTIKIGDDRVITFMGEELRVYETPSMIADIEYACRDLLFENLPTGYDSVGVIVNINHLAATPINETVEVTVEIEKIVSRKVTFTCRVHDAVELVGEGLHTRAIVDIERHRKRVGEKRNNMVTSTGR